MNILQAISVVLPVVSLKVLSPGQLLQLLEVGLQGTLQHCQDNLVHSTIVDELLYDRFHYVFLSGHAVTSFATGVNCLVALTFLVSTLTTCTIARP